MTYSTDCGCASCEGARAAHQEIERLNATIERVEALLDAAPVSQTGHVPIERVRAALEPTS